MHQYDSSQGIWEGGCGGVCLLCGTVRLGQFTKFGMVLGMVSWPVEALHIHVQILTGKFKMEFMPTVSQKHFLLHRFVQTCIK